MREYCLVNAHGNVINMSMSYRPGPPELTDYQKDKGYEWVPVGQVPMEKLRRYRYWNERP